MLAAKHKFSGDHAVVADHDLCSHGKGQSILQVVGVADAQRIVHARDVRDAHGFGESYVDSTCE